VNVNLFDHSAERQVIGAALVGHVETEVEIEHFHLIDHRPIWRAIKSMTAERRPVTIETLIAKLGDLTQIAYLTELISTTSTLAAPEYAKRVVDLAHRRGLMRVLEVAAKSISDSKEVSEIVANLQADSFQYARGPSQAREAGISHVVDEFLEAYANPRDVWGIRSGIGAIDHELGGIHKGETFMIAGDPGVGKSIFSTQLGYQMAGVQFWNEQIVGKSPGVMYHLEMSEEAIIRRALCALSKIEYRKVRSGKLSMEEQRRFMEAVETIEYAPVFISDSTEWNTTTMRADVARLIDEYGIEWVIVDYAGLLKDPAESEISREIKISRSLHDIAKMGVAMIVVETLNKAGLRGDRGMSGVRGSVQKVYDADVISLLQVPSDDKYPGTTARELMFTKAREADMYLKIPLILRGSQKRFEPKPRQGSLP